MSAAAANKRNSLVAILASCTSYGIGMGLTLPLLSLVLERMGVPGSVNGLNLATAGLASLVVTPFVPRAIARYGAANFLGACLLLAATAMMAIYEAPNLWIWFPVRFVLSSALNGLFVVTEFWINRLADEGHRGRYIALYTICMAGSFGIGPALLQVVGTHGIAPFAMGALLLLAALVPVSLARGHAPRIDTGIPASVYSMIAKAPATFAAAAVFGAIDAGMFGLFPVYAVRMGYSEAHAALAVTAMAAGSIAFQYPLGILTDRMNRRHLLALCAATGIVGAAVTPFVMAMPLLMYFVLFVWGGWVLGIYSVGLTLLGERFKGPDLASANAGFIMSYCMGLLAGPALEGVALDIWNPHGLLVVLGAISAAYVAYLLLVSPRRVPI
ncbi:MAG TPA: MFS transporter [Rhizomicrobium sp.]